MSSGQSNRPKASSPTVSAVMKRVRSKDNSGEMAIRKLLYHAGFRYRVHFTPTNFPYPRTKIDIAFPGLKLAVFLDGCFWHSCPQHGTIPKANKAWWKKKLAENQTRDQKVTTALKAKNWTVLRFWTHEDHNRIAEKVIKTVQLLKFGSENSLSKGS